MLPQELVDKRIYIPAVSGREFAQTVIAPHAEHVDRANNFPTDANLWQAMGEFGLLGEVPGPSTDRRHTSLGCMPSAARVVPVKLPHAPCTTEGRTLQAWLGTRGTRWHPQGVRSNARPGDRSL